MVIHILKSQALIKVNPFSVLSEKEGTWCAFTGKVHQVSWSLVAEIIYLCRRLW